MTEYSKEQRYALLQKFHDMDINGDGTLTKNEIQQCCKQSHLPPERINVSVRQFFSRIYLFKPLLKNDIFDNSRYV